MSTIVNKEIFAKRLTEVMEDHNDTIYTLGELLKLSGATISRYMNGKMAAKITTIKMIAMHYKVNPVWLMGYNVDKQLDSVLKSESKWETKKDKEETIETMIIELAIERGINIESKEGRDRVLELFKMAMKLSDMQKGL